ERHDARRWERHAFQVDAAEVSSCVIAAVGAGEDDHAANPLLKAGRVVGEQENRTARTDAEESHTGPDQQCPGDAITPRGQEDHATTGALCHLIERALNRVRVVRAPVSLPFYGDGAWIDGRGLESGR